MSRKTRQRSPEKFGSITDSETQNASLTAKSESPRTARHSKEILSVLYAENVKVASTFWEWRNKNLTSFFVGTGALFALAGWFHNQDLKGFIFVPLLFAAALSFVSFFLNLRTKRILTEAYRIGADLEKALIEDELIFGSIRDGHDSNITYSSTLDIVFLSSGLLLLLAALYALFAYGVLIPK